MTTNPDKQTPPGSKFTEEQRKKWPPFLHNTDYPYYVIDGKVYDLAEWIPLHPGGLDWFIVSHGRDISAPVFTYHKSPELLFKILKKYEVDMPVLEALDPSMNVPPHVVPETFDIHKDLVAFDWHKEDSFLSKVNKKMNTKEWKDKVARANFWFEVASFSILFVHVFMTFVGTYYELLPFPVMVVLFACTRTGLAGVGHYHCHRRKDNFTNWGDALFDI